MLPRHYLLANVKSCRPTRRSYENVSQTLTTPQRQRRACYSQQALHGNNNGKTSIGILSGKSIAVKDNIVTADLPTTASSNILDGLTAPYEATVVKLLKEHGAKVSSKTDLDEFGMGSHTQNAAQGAVESPYSRNGVALSPGGSSGGSAVAVVNGDCWAALGTDTGGSVRLPAAYTGLVGFKPSYGLLSRWGVIQYANSLDTVGILSKDVAAARQIFQVLNVYDKQDPTSLPEPTRARLLKNRTSAPANLRIGIPKQYNIAELTPVVRVAWLQTLQSLQKQGHSLHVVDLPSTQQALSAYYVLAPAEASSNLAKYDGIRYGRRGVKQTEISEHTLPLYARARDQGFGHEVKRRVLLGAYSLSSEAIDNYYIQAQKIRRLVQHDFDRVFALRNPLLDVNAVDQEAADVLITPTAPTLPPTVEVVSKQSALENYMNDVFTVPVSLAGLPAISVSVPLPSGHEMGSGDVKTVGLQVIGQFGDDETVLDVADLIHVS